MIRLVALLLTATSSGPPVAACPPCHLELDWLGSYGDADGLGALGAPRAFAMDADGRLYAVSEGAPAWIVVFSPGGRFVRRLGGPAVLDSVAALMVSGDSIFAFDATRPALIALNRDGGLIRRTPVPVQVQDAVRLGSGSWVVTGRSEGNGETEARPFHVLSPDGIRQGSTGPPQPLDWRGVYLLRRALTPDRRGGAWAAMPTAYHIDRLDTSGALVDSVIVSTDWFPPRARPMTTSPEHPAAPEVLDIAMDDAGNLLTLIRTPTPEWSRSLTPVPSGPGGDAAYTVSDPERAYASRVELRDTLGRRLTSTDTDLLLVGFLRSDRLLAFSRSTGTPQWSVWALRTVAGPEPVSGLHTQGRTIPVLAGLFAALGLGLWLLTGRLWRAPDAP